MTPDVGRSRTSNNHPNVRYWPKAAVREYHKRETLSEGPNDRFRLEADGQMLELRQAGNDP